MNYLCPRSLSWQLLAFPVTSATSGGQPGRAGATARRRPCPLQRGMLRASAAPATAGWLSRLSLLQNGPRKHGLL